MVKTLVETKADIGEKAKYIGFGCSNEYSLDQEINCLTFFMNSGRNCLSNDYAEETGERIEMLKYKKMDDSIESIYSMIKLLMKRIKSFKEKSEVVSSSNRLDNFCKSFIALASEFSKIRYELKANLYNSMVG